MTTFIQPPFWSPRFARQWSGHVSTRLVTPPAAEPLSVADAVLALRIPTADENTLVAAYIASARALIEQRISRALMPQTWDVTFDRLPYLGAALPLPIGPLRSVTSMTTVDLNDMATTMDPASYLTDLGSDPPRLVLASGVWWWPQSLRRTDAATVRIVVGYDTVPADILQALRLLVAHFYENRVATGVGIRFDAVLPLGVDDLLGPYLPVGVA